MTQWDRRSAQPEGFSISGKVRMENNKPPKNPVIETKIYTKEEIEKLNKQGNNHGEI